MSVVWVRDHSHHTPAHRIAYDQPPYRTLECDGEVRDGFVITLGAAVTQQVMWCRKCFDLPVPVIAPRFGAR